MKIKLLRLATTLFAALCSTGLHAAEPAAVVLMPLERMSIPAGAAPSTVTVDVRAARARLLKGAAGEADSLMLQFDEVEADRSPGVSYRVYVGAATDSKLEEANPAFAGNLTLYSAGIRSEARGEFHPASFRYRIAAQLEAALRRNRDALTITFAPQGDALVPVHIRSAAIILNR